MPQNWSLICAIIEITVEVISVTIYGILMYRFLTKRRLHKTMDARDKARSDLYLAQLRVQSAPNTPGLPHHRAAELANAKSPLGMAFPKTLHDTDSDSDDERVDAAEKGLHLEAADREYEERHAQFHMDVTPPPPAADREPREPTVNDHVPAAPGEQTYAAVPIPGSYASPVPTPSFAPANAMHYPAEAR